MNRPEPLAFGELAEWTIASVLKADKGYTYVGSNPTLSA